MKLVVQIDLATKSNTAGILTAYTDYSSISKSIVTRERANTL